MNTSQAGYWLNQDSEGGELETLKSTRARSRSLLVLIPLTFDERD
jgi:hypothetical protein